MRVMAFDLSWVGPTGWVIWDTSLRDPVYYWDSFQSQAKHDGPMRDSLISGQIANNVSSLLPHNNLDYVVYEITDWHRDLRNSDNYRVDYKIERVTQRALGKAEIAFLFGVRYGKFPIENVFSRGANETKEAFGARKKRDVAHLLADEFPDRFSVLDDDSSGFIYDLKQQMAVSDHVSDAMALAKVFADETNLKAMIKDAS